MGFFRLLSGLGPKRKHFSPLQQRCDLYFNFLNQSRRVAPELPDFSNQLLLKSSRPTREGSRQDKKKRGPTNKIERTVLSRGGPTKQSDILPGSHGPEEEGRGRGRDWTAYWAVIVGVEPAIRVRAVISRLGHGV